MPQKHSRQFQNQIDMLRRAGLRPTRQRIIIANYLFGDNLDKHVTAESLSLALHSQKIHVALATIYNTLHQFKDAGLLREVIVDATRSYFDTNTEKHYHLYDMDTQNLQDIPLSDIQINSIPQVSDYVVEDIEVVLKARKKSK
jgi:Fur family iron response transcriptional regulator